VSTRANFAGITFMPAAGLAYVHVAQNGVSENGAPGFNLNVNGNSANSLRPFVGLIAAKSYTTDGGMVITPEADIAYSYETLDTTPPSLIQVGGGSFTVPGLMPSRSQLTLGGGVTAQLTARPRLQILNLGLTDTRFTYRVKSMIASKRHPVDSL
jgi:outer membrane autotransporter protein